MKIEKEDTYMMNDSKDLLAKLLATENITVVRGNASTASFNVESRVLTLPLWKDMTIEQEEMLIGHEVGHALYTSNDFADDLKSSRALMSYMNVIEDVRIEKLIKKKYPGLKKSFTTAYKQLQEKDFFGVADKDLTKLLFIDRANLYFKAGFNCGVKFSADESVWLKKIDSCVSMKDVYELAVELLGWTREERQKQKDLLAAKMAQLGDFEEQEDDQDDEGFDDTNDVFDDLEDENEQSDAEGDSDEDGDEDGSTENDSNDKSSEDSTSLQQTESTEAGSGESVSGTSIESKTIVQEELDDCESLTDRNLSKNLAEQADTNVFYANTKYDETAIVYNPIIGYKTVLEELTKEYQESWRVQDYKEFYSSRNADADKFLNDCKKEVSYLVKEFEMKKQAARYSRAQQSKSGEIEVKKLYAYKLKEDLFKRITTLPDGKNHGMVMLLDWSGSMHPTMYDTLKQTVILAMFCAKIQIPYKVFAFTNGRSLDENQYKIVSEKRKVFYDKAKTETVIIPENFHLIEFFSNEMRSQEFQKMARYMIIGPFNFANRYGLHSTPLNEALWFMQSYMGKFIKENNVQIPTFITLTDGEGHSLQSYYPTVPRNADGERAEVKLSLVDPVTKKTYKNFRYGSEQTVALLKMIKDRYNCNTVGFHIIRNTRREIYNFAYHNMKDKLAGHYVTESAVAEIRSKFRDDGFMNVSTSFRDALFVIPHNKLKIEDGDLEVSGKMTSNQIARKFTKHLDTRRTSKVLLNQFVRMVA